MHESSPGFTLVELIMVIVLLGILSYYAIPRFVGIADFRSAGFYQEVVSATRYAHRLAVGRGDNVRIKFINNGYKLYYQDSTGGYKTLPDSHPVHYSTESSIQLEIKDSGSIPLNATFDGLGRCKFQDTNKDTLPVDIGGKTMTIYSETGYVNATS